MRFRLATWNINSVRLRLDLIERFTRAYRPDVLCLQEIKCIDRLFPELPLRALGFDHVAISGQKGYHGVAVLSRIPFAKIQRRDICGRGHARHLSVTLDGGAPQAKPLVLHNVYVPAGGDVPDPALNPKFRHKLDFLEAMEKLHDVICGGGSLHTGPLLRHNPAAMSCAGWTLANAPLSAAR